MSQYNFPLKPCRQRNLRSNDRHSWPSKNALHDWSRRSIRPLAGRNYEYVNGFWCASELSKQGDGSVRVVRTPIRFVHERSVKHQMRQAMGFTVTEPGIL